MRCDMNGPAEDSRTPEEIDLTQATDPAGSPDSAPAVEAQNRRSSDLLRRLFACNPFYVVSVALLLFGCYRISMEPALFNHESAHLFFNFTSLQVYELLLVGTAIFLARRRIWYDSTLLAGLENLLVLVPFILISQATLIDRDITWALCVLGGILALTRLVALKRWIAELNLPSQTLAAGALILTVNSFLPAIYRHFHESKFGNRPDWGAAYQVNQWLWWLILPVLCGVAAWSARLVQKGELWPQRRWLPAALVSLWMTGTGVHVYC